MAGSLVQQFVNGLKSRNEDIRLKTARDLHHYVSFNFMLFTRIQFHL